MSVTLTDPRGRRSRAALHWALLRLLEDTQLSDVTVAALCRQAGLHRTTFYKHYAGLEDCAAAALTDLVRELVDGLPDVQQLAAEATARLDAQPTHFRPLASAQLSSRVRSELEHLLAASCPPDQAAMLAGALAALVAFHLDQPDEPLSGALEAWQLLARCAPQGE